MNLIDNITNVTFPLQQTEGNDNVFWFKQSKTVTIHIVLTLTKRKQYYEINFGVIENNNMRVLIKTNTNKALRTFNTIVQACIYFLSLNPKSFLIFSASDRSRSNFYQRRITRYLPIFEKEFKIWGIHSFSDKELLKEPYEPNNYYDEIVIGLK